MPRSYSFDHFQVPKARAQEPRACAAGTSRTCPSGCARSAAGDKEIHYGRSHAETEEIFQPAPMERRSSRSWAAGTKFAHAQPREPVKPRRASRAPGAHGAHRRAAQGGGAVLLSRGALRDVLDEALRQLRALQRASRTSPAPRRGWPPLPLEAARLAAQRLRLVHG